MSPWPGAPKSASSPPINPPSNRFPFTLSESSSMGDVVDAMRTAYNGLTVHEQAFANIPAQVATQAMAAATTVIQESETVTTTPAGVTSFNGQTGAVLYFPAGGATADRPGAPYSFFQYFDTDLGYPVWWNGSAWVNASGFPA